MKKLMTMIGVAAMAFGLYADFKYNQTDFKDTPLGVLDITKNDAGGDTTPFYWAGDAGDSEVKAVSEAEGAKKFLAIDNSAPLYRTVNSGPDAEAQAIGTGVFADMFVKFTASDAADPVVLADGSKLGIWVAADEESETPSTNLMVCAASLVEGATVPVATNFTIAVGADFDFTAEHRVTIRAIDEISSGKLGMAGFVIYVDGALVAAADADYADKIGFTAFNTVAAPFYANNQLFVSLVEAGTLGAQKITGVGFKGSGELAKVALTDADNAPEFAKPAVDVTIAWDDGVTGFTYQGIATNVDAAGSVVVTLASPSVPVTLSNVTIDTANYVDGGIDAVNLSSSEAGVWTFTAAPASLTMKAAPVAFTIGDEKYATFEDALKAAGGKTIKLAKDFAIDGKYINIGDEAGEAPISTTIDLAGKTIDVANNDVCGFYVGANSTLTVIDTVGGGNLTASEVDDEFYGVFYSEGTCLIGNEVDDQGITADALIGSGYLTIVKGKFLDIPDVQGQEDLENFLPEEGDYEVVADGAYWKVQKQQAEKGTVLLITNAGATTTTNNYETLALALEAAQSSDIVMPTAEIAELQTTITVKEGVTLDLNNQIVNVDFHQTKLSNAGKIVIYNNSLALVNNWYIGGNFEAGEALTDGSNFSFPKGTQMDVAKKTAVQTAITITGDILWGLPIESNKLVTVVGTPTINAMIYPTATLTVPNAITPTLTTIKGFEVKSTVGAAMTTWAAEEKQEQVVKPGEPVGLGNGGDFETEEDAQAAADKLDFDIDQADKDAGLTKEAVMVKAEFIGGAWMAVLEPKEAPVVDDEVAIEVTDTDFGATVENPVPGVYYGFVATDTLGTKFEAVGEYVRAKSTDETLKLTAPKGKGNACFYKLNAALRDPTKK